jgi:hypothetical protein
MCIGVIQLHVLKYRGILGFDVVLDLEKYVPSVVFANGAQVIIALGWNANDPRELVDDFSAVFNGVDFLTNILFDLLVPWR